MDEERGLDNCLYASNLELLLDCLKKRFQVSLVCVLSGPPNPKSLFRGRLGNDLKVNSIERNQT